jgi:hypothetical protein
MSPGTRQFIMEMMESPGKGAVGEGWPVRRLSFEETIRAPQPRAGGADHDPWPSGATDVVALESPAVLTTRLVVEQQGMGHAASAAGSGPRDVRVDGRPPTTPPPPAPAAVSRKRKAVKKERGPKKRVANRTSSQAFVCNEIDAFHNLAGESYLRMLQRLQAAHCKHMKLNVNDAQITAWSRRLQQFSLQTQLMAALARQQLQYLSNSAMEVRTLNEVRYDGECSMITLQRAVNSGNVVRALSIVQAMPGLNTPEMERALHNIALAAREALRLNGTNALLPDVIQAVLTLVGRR